MKILIYLLLFVLSGCFARNEVLTCSFHSYFLQYKTKNDGMQFSVPDSVQCKLDVPAKMLRNTGKRVLPDICLDGLGVSDRLYCGSYTYNFLCHDHSLAYRVDKDDSVTIFELDEFLVKKIDLMDSASQE